MPKRIPQEVQQLLDNQIWLQEQHVTNCYGIAELARELQVTPNIVRKAIRKFNIQSPSQQSLREASNLRKYGVKNPGQLKEIRDKANKTMTERFGGHIFSTKEGKAKRDQTCLKKYGNINAAKNTNIRKKISKSKLKDNFDSLTDRGWLYEQHYTHNKSINEIASELNTTWATVKTYFSKAGVKVRPNSLIPHNTEKLLLDKNWLVEQHHTLRKPFSVIARELKVQGDTVRRYANKAGVPVLQHSSLSTEIYDKLTDPEWLTEQCVVQMKNPKQLGEELNISPTTVAEYCKKINVTSTAKNRKLSNDVLLKLENREWLYDQHHTLRKPLVQIASELGLCKKTPTNSGILTTYTRKHDIPVRNFSHSAGEKQILAFIQSLLPTTTIHENSQRVISPYELDIFIPDYNLAIEYCGLYWHSDKFKENFYHRNKMRACNNKGIRLLTIFEDEWLNSQEIVKSKIKNILGVDDRATVFARKTHIVNVTNTTKKQFFDKYHIQGTGPGSITYGLIHNGELVAAMTLIKRSNGKYELNRYATSCNVVGGFTKLLKHFQHINDDWTEITSFADLRWSEGQLYENTGWKLDKVLPPDYFWVKNGERHHKFNFRHKFLPQRLEVYDPCLSENENCKINGYHKIFNCGLNRYVLKR